jgi:hypothetical protein
MPERWIEIVRRAYDPVARGVDDADLLSALAEVRRLISNWPWGEHPFEAAGLSE